MRTQLLAEVGLSTRVKSLDFNKVVDRVRIEANDKTYQYTALILAMTTKI